MKQTNYKLRAISVGVLTQSGQDFNQQMQELAGLADALEIEVCASLVQNLKSFDPSFYIGEGKVGELYRLAKELEVDLIIFNDELTPNQFRNLDRLLPFALYDRSSIILKIFSTRAKSKEAIIQIEMATLEYNKTRLVGSNQHLSRQGGGMKNKGSGEKKIDLDRQAINRRLAYLRKELKNIEKVRKVKGAARQKIDLPLVCLAGYTNAGKSTLMNTFLQRYNHNDDKLTISKDMLFTTLDSTTRIINGSQNKFILSDTVGFINKLPHNLVEAFHSTLESIVEADVVLHVIDYSDPDFLNKMLVAEEVFTKLEIDRRKIINVYNKCDNIEGVYLGYSEENNVYISASLDVGISQLEKLIFKTTAGDFKSYKLFIPYENIEQYQKLIKQFYISNVKEDDKGIYFSLISRYIEKTEFAKYIQN